MDTKIETPENPVEDKPKTLNLPRSENPVMEYNEATKMFWVGIPADKMAPFEAVLLYDSMKLEYFKAFAHTQQVAQQAKSKIITPGALNKMRENFVAKFKK